VDSRLRGSDILGKHSLLLKFVIINHYSVAIYKQQMNYCKKQETTFVLSFPCWLVSISFVIAKSISDAAIHFLYFSFFVVFIDSRFRGNNKVEVYFHISILSSFALYIMSTPPLPSFPCSLESIFTEMRENLHIFFISLFLFQYLFKIFVDSRLRGNDEVA
jgi:hypothetical protein